MEFKSILFNQETSQTIHEDEPDYFTDLNLDQVINTITKSKKEYNLKPFYHTPLVDYDLILYRTEIMKDLANVKLKTIIENFAEKMVLMDQDFKLHEKSDFEFHRKGWYLETALIYIEAINSLFTDLTSINLNSSGLNQFKEYLAEYTKSTKFISLVQAASTNKKNLSSLKYCINLQEDWLSVKKYENEDDYSVEILETFDKFKQHNSKDYKIKMHNIERMNHIDGKILEFVARLFPKAFQDLTAFYIQFPGFIDITISVFNREIQFYLAYLDFISKIKNKGLNFCFPTLCKTKQDVYNYNTFDIALASRFLSKNEQIVSNDFYLQDKERIIVVTGPNQGGKTTFARLFGQIHYLARLGIPIPGSQAQLILSDQIFTHFEREENITTLRGNLQNELVRLKKIFSNMTSNSIVIINEIFNSTTLEDAAFLSKEILKKFIQSDCFGIIVTFLDELSNFAPQTVSMVSNVDPDDPSVKTFKITRKESNGLAYAFSIAKKHRLTYDLIKERMKS